MEEQFDLTEDQMKALDSLVDKQSTFVIPMWGGFIQMFPANNGVWTAVMNDTSGA